MQEALVIVCRHHESSQQEHPRSLIYNVRYLRRGRALEKLSSMLQPYLASCLPYLIYGRLRNAASGQLSTSWVECDSLVQGDNLRQRKQITTLRHIHQRLNVYPANVSSFLALNTSPLVHLVEEQRYAESSRHREWESTGERMTKRKRGRERKGDSE